MKGREQLYDELLVLRCQERDTAAFEELVDRCQPRLWRYAYHLTEREDRAWDMVQETWAAVVKGISGLEDAASFPRWIYRILTNRCADATRKRIRERHLIETLTRGCPTPAKTCKCDETPIDDLRTAINQLPTELRSLLALRFGEGLSIRDIGMVLDIPEGTVKSRLFHAKQKLKDIIRREQNGNG